jgi:hypothetical protein
MLPSRVSYGIIVHHAQLLHKQSGWWLAIQELLPSTSLASHVARDSC